MDTLDQPLEMKAIYPGQPGKGRGRFRYVFLLLSLMMLIVAFNSPASAWPIDFEVFGYRIHGNVLYWLFTVSIVAYIPLAVGGVILFFYDIIQLLKSKQRRHAINLVVFSTTIFIALYRFNGWIFGRIF